MTNATDQMRTKTRVTTILGACAITLIMVAAISTPAMTIATLSYLLLLGGLAVRKSNVRQHAVMMASGMAVDLSLVLILQFSRDAVQTAVGLTLGPIQMTHVVTSTTATVFYIPTVILGIVLLRNPSARARLLGTHKKVAWTAFIFRTIGFVTMFSMLWRTTGRS